MIDRLIVAVMVTGLLFMSGLVATPTQTPTTLPAPFYVLDGFGGLHAVEAPTLSPPPYLGFDIYEGLEIIQTRCDPNSLFGYQVDAYVLDGFGNLWFLQSDASSAVQVTQAPVFGFDVARAVAAVPGGAC